MNADDPASNLMQVRGFGKKEAVSNTKFKDRNRNAEGRTENGRLNFCLPSREQSDF